MLPYPLPVSFRWVRGQRSGCRESCSKWCDLICHSVRWHRPNCPSSMVMMLATEPHSPLTARSSSDSENGVNNDLTVVRDGSVDDTFGTNGSVSFDISGGRIKAEAIASLADGKILVAGRGGMISHWSDYSVTVTRRPPLPTRLQSTLCLLHRLC